MTLERTEQGGADALKGSTCDADRVSFYLHLGGSVANKARPDGWQMQYLDGPYTVRSAQVGQQEFVNAGVTFQVNTFLAHKGIAAPRDTNQVIQSRGVGEMFIPCAGIWWFRPIRLDIEMDIVFTPVANANQVDTVDSMGLGNLHSHLGLTLSSMANSGGDATVPAADTFYLIGPYRPRKALVIYVPEIVYKGTWDGGANPNWINAGDTYIDQVGVDVLLGVSTFIQGNNLGQLLTWHLPSDVANALGTGMDTIRAGDRVVFTGDTRWVGPVLLFNLRQNAPIFFTVEEYT